MIAATSNTDARSAGNRFGLLRFIGRATARTAVRVRRCSQGEDGSTLAEMALVLPILLVVLTGVFSFGIILNQYLVLTNAVNNGARAFAMSAPSSDGNISIEDSGDPCKYAGQAIENSAGTLVSSNINLTINYTTYLGNTSSSGTTTTYTGTGSSLPSCASLKMYQLDVVQIQATYAVTPVLYGWASKQFTLNATTTELVQ
jgi:Flp pilus assembly protein TadG